MCYISEGMLSELYPAKRPWLISTLYFSNLNKCSLRNFEFFYLKMASRKRAKIYDIPSPSTPAPSSAIIEPDVQSSQTLVPMLQSLFQGQVIIMHSLRELAHQRPIITMEQFLEQVARPGALPSMVRPNEAASPEPTPARVEPVPADPQSPAANSPSPKLEVVPPSPPIIIISDSPSGESVAPPDSPAGEAADLSGSLSGEVVALSDSPIFHLIDEEEAQT